MAAVIEVKPTCAQALRLLAPFALALGTCLLIDVAARNRILEHQITAERSALSVRNGKLFSNEGSFMDYEERILLDEMPLTDFSHGGLYFFGTSNMKWALTTWDLPDRLRVRLHDYGSGGASHQTIARLVRYVGEKGLFRTGNKSEVVIGVSYHLGIPETQANYFPALVRRQGVYAIAPDDRLVEAPMSPLERWFRIEKARSAGFVWNVGRLAHDWVWARLGRSYQQPHDPAFYRSTWRAFMGLDWRHNTDRELVYLRDTINLLHAHGVLVKIILLPQGTWMNELPYPPYYDSRVRAIASVTGTPLLDWSRTLPDSDFIDSNHLTNAGQTRFREMVLREEAQVLR